VTGPVTAAGPAVPLRSLVRRARKYHSAASTAPPPDYGNGKQPAEDVQTGSYRKACSLWIKVADLSKCRCGNQQVKIVQGSVKGWVRAWAHWHRVMGAEYQPSHDERTC
jgi:hypothetical protein